MYIVKSIDKFETIEDAVYFLMSHITEAGVDEDFEIVEV